MTAVPARDVLRPRGWQDPEIIAILAQHFTTRGATIDDIARVRVARRDRDREVQGMKLRCQIYWLARACVDQGAPHELTILHWEHRYEELLAKIGSLSAASEAFGSHLSSLAAAISEYMELVKSIVADMRQLLPDIQASIDAALEHERVFITGQRWNPRYWLVRAS